MTKVKFSYRMELSFDHVVRQHAFSILAFPQNLSEQQIFGLNWQIWPETPLWFQTDGFGNRVGAGFCESEHRSFSFQMGGVAWIQQEKRKAESLHGMYRYPSEYCRINDEMRDFLRRSGAPERASGLQKAKWIMNCLYESFQYETGCTSVYTDAKVAFLQKKGVCQDYSHILITLCREKGIPARYVAGIIAGEGATHAWVEIYDDGIWHGLDPTHNCEVNNYYLKLSHGRDYQDCRLNRGLFQGNSGQMQSVFVNLEEIDSW